MNIHKFFMGRALGFTVVIVVLGLFWAFTLVRDLVSEPAAINPGDYKNAAYMIEGDRVQLHDGISEVEAVPGSPVNISTKYFGNELRTDLNGDGVEDVAFILTQNAGGSGQFFYVVGAVKTEDGYVGSDGYLLGDRIAPQTTEVSQNLRQKNVIVVNYADRAQGEPMTTQPSIGKSAYLKLDPSSMQWGIVEPNFEGESR